MASIFAEKPHIVCVAFPAQGHVNPFMQLAKLLHSRGFYITFVNTDYYYQGLLHSIGSDAFKGLDDFHFETIPDGGINDDQDSATFCHSVQRNCRAPLIDLVVKLNSSSDVPKVSCIISDGMMSSAIQAAQRLGIPEVQFWTASACGLMACVHFRELIKQGLVPLKDESYLSNGYLDTLIEWIPGMKDLRLKNFPSFIRTTDSNDIMLNFFKEETQNCLNASAIIINTFDELEFEVLNAMSSIFPKVFTLGHLPLLSSHFPESELKSLKSLKSSLWKEDSDCLAWLQDKAPNSVVYVNFGSVTEMSKQQLIEFGWGLANSKHPFLWIIRPGMLIGDSASLPEELMEETKNRGMIAKWCPQEQVLCHPSVGGFLTHCGWNSMMESLCGGVPMICWPFFSEQFTNCHYACTVWGIGMQINNNVKRGEIEMLVKEMMKGKKGKEMRNNALKWKKKVENATKEGGSSYKNFDKFCKEVLELKTM